MIYAFIQDGTIAEYPVYEGDIRLRYPNISFGVNFVPPEGYVQVTDTTRPDVDYKKVVTEGQPEFVNGQWARVWIVTDATAEQIAEYETSLIQYNLQIRNRLLVESDWSGLTDCTLSDEKKAEWASYRQALRDITAQEGFPHNITWPTKPE